MKSRIKSRMKSRKKKGGDIPIETLREEERELKDNLNKSQQNIRVLDTAIFNYQMAIRNLDEQIKKKIPIFPGARKRQKIRKADLKKFNETLEKKIESKKSEATKLFNIKSRLTEKQKEIDKHPDTIKEKERLAAIEKRVSERKREQERFLREFHEQQERERGQTEITSRLLDEETSTREPKLPPPRPPPIEREVSIDRPKYGEIQILDGGKSRKSRKHKSRKSRK